MEINYEDLKTKRLTASGIVIDHAAWLYSIIGNSYADSSSLIYIRNGQDTSGNIILDLSGSQFGSDIIVFNCPVYFNRGIYAEFSTAGYSVFAQFILEY